MVNAAFYTTRWARLTLSISLNFCTKKGYNKWTLLQQQLKASENILSREKFFKARIALLKNIIKLLTQH